MIDLLKRFGSAFGMPVETIDDVPRLMYIARNNNHWGWLEQMEEYSHKMEAYVLGEFDLEVCANARDA
jgi:hypothetical protein